MIPLIIIAGPTASGKTALAIEIAKEIGGEIISADSMQIYKGMDIATAKPTAEEMQGIPHHMLGIAEPDEAFSLARYASMAHEIIAQVAHRGKIPILAGGTGLYIDAVVSNLRLPEEGYDKELRERLAGECEALGVQAMYDRLCEIDAQAAKKLHVNDTKRVLRALEVYYATGQTKTQADGIAKASEKIYDYLYFAIETEREVLYNNIDMRVEAMIESGLFREAQALYKACGRFTSTAAQAIGYKETFYYLRGLASRDEAVRLLKRNTRHLAKRQMTWFRKNEDIVWVGAKASGECVGMIRRHLAGRESTDCVQL